MPNTSQAHPLSHLQQPRRYVSPRDCQHCHRREATVVCQGCGAFKLPKAIEPFAEKDAA